MNPFSNIYLFLNSIVPLSRIIGDFFFFSNDAVCYIYEIKVGVTNCAIVIRQDFLLSIHASGDKIENNRCFINVFRISGPFHLATGILTNGPGSELRVPSSQQ